MSKVYRVEATTEDGTALAATDGDVDIASYVGRKLIATLADVKVNVDLNFTELTAVSGQESRSIARLTADAETVSYVLKAKLAAERKANKPADAGNALDASETVVIQ